MSIEKKKDSQHISQIVDLKSHDMKSFFFKTKSKHSDLDFILQESDSDIDYDPVESYGVLALPIHHSMQIT